MDGQSNSNNLHIFVGFLADKDGKWNIGPVMQLSNANEMNCLQNPRSSYSGNALVSSFSDNNIIINHIINLYAE